MLKLSNIKFDAIKIDSLENYYISEKCKSSNLVHIEYGWGEF